MMTTDTLFSADDKRFDADYDQNRVPKEKKSLWTTCLVGCLVMFGVAMVVVVLTTLWVSRNWRDWASTLAAEGINQGIDASDLPPQEKAEIKVEVKRVTDAFRDGLISNEQVGAIMTKLFESPLMTSLIVAAVETKYLDNSGLSDEEKAAGRNTLQRYVRGMIDGAIDEQSLETVLAHISDRQPDGNWTLRQQVSDEELRTFLAAAKSEADQAEVPDQPESFDPSDEFQRIIDEAMNEP